MVARIRMGQVWRHNATGETYLVTRVYEEAFSTYAVLRKVGLEVGDTLRLKVQKTAEGIALEGYTFTQEEERKL
ncbi:MAG: hypothetical protein HY653_07325 [Acidobacteria bacterium]|nr:hypothetical protein [Acidobacteriota bacterium]